MTPEEERNLAVKARYEARMLREKWASVGRIVHVVHPKPLWPAMLPESCFDWPVYLIALGVYDTPRGGRK